MSLYSVDYYAETIYGGTFVYASRSCTGTSLWFTAICRVQVDPVKMAAHNLTKYQILSALPTLIYLPELYTVKTSTQALEPRDNYKMLKNITI
ncbi:MAG: hypothetical protein O7C58_00725 [Rickettsia endosymbiont of Ixodes persulcatus]|nr:hypothetical protein [Rickettsia endosymbiont of Ixodes persulcatus]